MENKTILKILLAGKRIFPSSIETSNWIAWKANNSIYLRSDFDYDHKKVEYPWSMNHCIHYPELAVSRITELEQVMIVYFGDELMEEAILEDTNKTQKKYTHNWQYPTLSNWIIKRDDVIFVN